MRFFVGTSGYSYKEWKGSFYPAKLPQKEMLSYYAQRFSAVEINSTFRRMPKAHVLKAWIEQVPKGFRFVLKAPQTITHYKRLKNAEAEVDHLLSTASMLQIARGPVLFQLPPNFQQDLPRLEAFLAMVGKRIPIAFEFRHDSWFDEDVFRCLRKNSCALCVADTDEGPSVDLVKTARWGYLRLRRAKYTDKQLRRWLERTRSQKWREVFVFFKHEATGTGPKLAARLLKLTGS